MSREDVQLRAARCSARARERLAGGDVQGYARYERRAQELRRVVEDLERRERRA